MRIRWREFELPNRVVRDESVSNGKYGLFVAEPFERGFGQTVGNGLRRVLLSSLEGAAVTHVKIAGVQHEFSTIDGVVEDMTELVLNVKRLLVKVTAPDPRRLVLKKRGKGPVTAADFAETNEISVVNKDLYLCTIAKGDTEFECEVTVRRGRGYVTAEENVSEEAEVGTIPVDSIFSPVHRVKYAIESTRVGKSTDYDRLVLEIWTDGTVTPEMALVEASKIYRKHLNPFVQYFELKEDLAVDGGVLAPEGDEGAKKREMTDLLNRSIDMLELSVRAKNCLDSENVTTLRDLVQMTEPELLKVRNFGKTSLKEVKTKLQALGLSLGYQAEGGSAPPAAGDNE